ncbi:transmembrane protease serine 4 isoform X2 [Pseudophryne corroboree]|uniref:transmembrane protease serine 4 isoform X2 n=1 Tax=Pseudophryne corroboree TaxID=495146 RepID=UPI0030812382
MNPGDEADVASPLNRTGASDGGGESAQPTRSSQPAAIASSTPSGRPPAPSSATTAATRVPAPVSRPPGPVRPPVSRPGGPTRTPGPVRGTPRPNARPNPRPNARPNARPGAHPINYKIRRISALRRYCVPVTTLIIVLASLVVIAILIKVVLDNYYYFCTKSFKFIPLDKWCDGVSDCAGGEDELRCVQPVDYSNSSIVRLSDADSVVQILTSSGAWSYICYDGFNTAAAKAVCAQLGYSSTPSFSQIPSPASNGVYSNILLSGSGIQVVPITGNCSSGNVVSLTCLVCGVNHKKERIIGGHDALIDNVPWQVSMQYMGQHLCGGSIIAPRIILCAAHCFQKTQKQVDRWRVQAGGSTLTYLFASPVDKIFIPTSYILEQKPYDIALIKLKNDLTLSATVQPVCLPGFDNNLPSGSPLLVTGWGDISEGGALAQTLQEVSITSIPNDVCNQEYFGQILDSMLCAGRLSGGTDACQGDSGGPLVYLGQNTHWEQVGVVSWGEGCGRPGKVGVYTRVASYLSWIYGIMKREL